jgi:Cof subfamily protein (haloacid dehalogenase superfamily)
MIVTDLDGTLLDSDKNISEYTANILNRCHGMGIKIIIATGRTRNIAEKFLKKKIHVDGIISMNGALLYIGNEIIKKIIFDNSIQKNVLHELSHNDCIIKITGQTGELSLSGNPKDESEILFDFKKETAPPICMLSFRYSESEVIRLISSRFPALHFFPFSTVNLVDILPSEATKWKGLQFISSYFNIEPSSVAAFGDDNNDVEMLKNCGTGVAVNNAIDEAKAVARFVCDTNNNNGVAKWLAENVLGE